MSSAKFSGASPIGSDEEPSFEEVIDGLTMGMNISARYTKPAPPISPRPSEKSFRSLSSLSSDMYNENLKVIIQNLSTQINSLENLNQSFIASMEKSPSEASTHFMEFKRKFESIRVRVN